jgi:transcriptional regulator with XRE-family HTH domain
MLVVNIKNSTCAILKEDNMAIVERIKLKCKEKNTSMSALEKQIGIGNGNIRRWDDKIPGCDKIIAVANMLEVSIDWLLTGKEADELSPEEQKLINYYRNTDERGKNTIMNIAASQPSSQEQKSSISQIG